MKQLSCLPLLSHQFIPKRTESEVWPPESIISASAPSLSLHQNKVLTISEHFFIAAMKHVYLLLDIGWMDGWIFNHWRALLRPCWSSVLSFLALADWGAAEGEGRGRVDPPNYRNCKKHPRFFLAAHPFSLSLKVSGLHHSSLKITALKSSQSDLAAAQEAGCCFTHGELFFKNHGKSGGHIASHLTKSTSW